MMIPLIETNRLLLSFCLIALIVLCACKEKANVSSRLDHISQSESNNLKNICPGIKDSSLVEYVINSVLEKPDYIKHITDRSKLWKLPNKICWENYVLIEGTEANGTNYKIELKGAEFDSTKHEVVFDGSGMIKSIDSRFPFGASNNLMTLPEKEIKEIIIEINHEPISVPKSAYNNLYEPEFCFFGGWRKKTEAFLNQDYVYVYIFGGNASNSYMAKLVFNKEEYITSIIVDYYPLSCFGSFWDGFIGY